MLEVLSNINKIKTSLHPELKFFPHDQYQTDVTASQVPPGSACGWGTEEVTNAALIITC